MDDDRIWATGRRQPRTPVASTILLALLAYSSFTPAAHAREPGFLVLAAGYSDNGRIIADIDENEIDPDRYADYALDVGLVRSVRVTAPKLHLYAHYTRMDTLDEEGRAQRNQFNSVALGFSDETQQQISANVHRYLLLEGGAGVAQFNFGPNRSHAMAEAGAEFGLVLFRRFSAGLGFDYQMIGHPGETIAEAGYVSVNVGLRL